MARTVLPTVLAVVALVAIAQLGSLSFVASPSSSEASPALRGQELMTKGGLAATAAYASAAAVVPSPAEAALSEKQWNSFGQVFAI
eukprot:CAMPEP_0115418198 /NCGR_PEP_ID=MMETSP0271-20121206/24533_1 /TAXON_ID=71861 /ORGANISM="Scrippsiella trochoidea, Strain CCMP3099" /LENGTH=85 /DNA_ID=CAMNT_0002842643 /DNA_START=83 /DNA_END=337 /DNA_ORIENTATION=+